MVKEAFGNIAVNVVGTIIGVMIIALVYGVQAAIGVIIPMCLVYCCLFIFSLFCIKGIQKQQQ